MTVNASVRIGILGMGQMGAFLARALARSGQDVTAIWSRDFDHADDVAQSIPRCRATVIPQSAVDNADLIFITTPDAAIEPFACSLAWWRGQSVVHCSGALDRQVLSAAAEVGADTGCFHPLQSITEASAPDALNGVAIAIEAQHLMKDRLADIARSLGARPVTVEPGRRARYHAGATMASNYLVTLVSCAAELLQSAGLSRADAIDGLVSLMRSSLENVASLGPTNALTGPIVRGDIVTVQRHLDALAGTPEIADIYRCLGRQTVTLAEESGRLDLEQSRRLFQTLDEYHSHERTAPCA